MADRSKSRELALGLFAAQDKLAQLFFKPLAKVEAEAKKSCKECSNDEVYAPAKEASWVKPPPEFLLGLGLTTAAAIGNSLAQANLTERIERRSNKDRDKELIEDLAAKAGVPIHHTPDSNSFFLPVTVHKQGPESETAPGVVFLGKLNSPAVLAHEFGHASSSDLLAKVAPPLNALAPLTSVLGAIAGKTGKPSAVAGAAALPAVLSIPQIAEEVRASNIALDKLRDAGASKKELAEAKKQLDAALLTHVTASIVPSGYSLLLTGFNKQASVRRKALTEELKSLGAVTEKQADALAANSPIPFQPAPLKNNISEDEARFALQRLKRLEEGKPTRDQLMRGMGVGAAVGPLASLAFRSIAGKRVRAPTDQQFFPHFRQLAAQAGHGAIFGGLMPAVTNRLEREAEKSKLRNFLAQRQQESVVPQALPRPLSGTQQNF